MSRPKEDNPTQAPSAEAARWFIELQAADLTRESQEAFTDWLRRSPVNVEEFLRYTALHGELARLDELKQIDVSSLLRDAGDLQNVVDFDSTGAAAFAGTKSRSSAQVHGGDATQRSVGVPDGRPRRKYAIAAALAAIAAGTALLFAAQGFFGAERYRTSTGEQRSLLLADGSHVQLNVRSSLTARVSRTGRDIRLDDGEALFRVARDATRPFRVHTPQASIEATGTQFNVHVRDNHTVVALLEGKVLVRSAAASAAVALDPGEELTVAHGMGALPAPKAMDPRTVIAWTERRLVFEDAPLSDVVAEFNRYSRQPLAIEDPALRDMRITASFDSGSTQTFADSLAAAGNLRVSHRADGSWLIERQKK